MNPLESVDVPYVHTLSPAQLRAHQANTASALGLTTEMDKTLSDTLRDGSPGPRLALIPPGIFMFGAPESERRFGEAPQRYVTVNTPYALGCQCVSADEFECFTRDGGHAWAPHLLRTEGAEPVTNIDRATAIAYLDWLSAQTGQRYRLPSEIEWEYAARAGSAAAYSVGDELGCSAANTGSFRIQGRNSDGWRRFLPFCMPSGRVTPAGLYPANLWGLYDMHGNVWEFTADTWQGPLDAQVSARHNRGGDWFITKGGSWFDPAWQARSAARKPRHRNELDTNLGFRVLRELV